MSEQMRKEFQEWADSWGVKKGTTEYNNFFECWQASRQALVVKLPDACCEACQMVRIDNVEDALDAAGVKYE